MMFNTHEIMKSKDSNILHVLHSKNNILYIAINAKKIFKIRNYSQGHYQGHNEASGRTNVSSSKHSH